MRYLFRYWDVLEQKLKENRLFLFLDYDGTLASISEIPEKARLPKKTKDVLIELSRLARCRLAVVSGRSLMDIKNMVGIAGLIYIGNHGMEIEGPKIRFRRPTTFGFRNALQQIKEGLSKKLIAKKGVLIEDKNLTLSLHYRLANRNDTDLIKKVFKEITRPYLKTGEIKVGAGKKVLEIRPPVEWDKGKVALWLLAREQLESGDEEVQSIYIGDDSTDEDAFAVLKNKGPTIFIGEGRQKNSCAQYYLKNTEEVVKLLQMILKLRKAKLYARAEKSKRAF